MRAQVRGAVGGGADGDGSVGRVRAARFWGAPRRRRSGREVVPRVRRRPCGAAARSVVASSDMPGVACMAVGRHSTAAGAATPGAARHVLGAAGAVCRAAVRFCGVPERAPGGAVLASDGAERKVGKQNRRRRCALRRCATLSLSLWAHAGTGEKLMNRVRGWMSGRPAHAGTGKGRKKRMRGWMSGWLRQWGAACRTAVQALAFADARLEVWERAWKCGSVWKCGSPSGSVGAW
eukprot:366341-Chlamydomonas_euryale.AAC.29